MKTTTAKNFMMLVAVSVVAGLIVEAIKGSWRERRA